MSSVSENGSCVSGSAAPATTLTGSPAASIPPTDQEWDLKLPDNKALIDFVDKATTLALHHAQGGVIGERRRYISWRAAGEWPEGLAAPKMWAERTQEDKDKLTATAFTQILLDAAMMTDVAKQTGGIYDNDEDDGMDGNYPHGNKIGVSGVQFRASASQNVTNHSESTMARSQGRDARIALEEFQIHDKHPAKSRGARDTAILSHFRAGFSMLLEVATTLDPEADKDLLSQYPTEWQTLYKQTYDMLDHAPVTSCAAGVKTTWTETRNGEEIVYTSAFGKPRDYTGDGFGESEQINSIREHCARETAQATQSPLRPRCSPSEHEAIGRFTSQFRPKGRRPRSINTVTQSSSKTDAPTTLSGRSRATSGRSQYPHSSQTREARTSDRSRRPESAWYQSARKGLSDFTKNWGGRGSRPSSTGTSCGPPTQVGQSESLISCV